MIFGNLVSKRKCFKRKRLNYLINIKGIQSVKAQIDKEWDEKFPALLALIKDDQRLTKLRPCIGKELCARFAFTRRKWKNISQKFILYRFKYWNLILIFTNGIGKTSIIRMH